MVNKDEPAGRVLIVEDEAMIAEFLRRMLVRMGFSIIATVPSGEKAIQLVEDQKPDVILMDICLAGELDGVETANIIHQKHDIPIVYLTAYMDDILLERAMSTTPYGYLVKPVQDKDLRATLEVTLYKHSLDKKLRENEERYRRISETVSDYAYMYSLLPDDTIWLEWMSDAFSQLTGYKLKEARTLEEWISFIYPEDRPIILEHMRGIHKGEVKVFEVRVIQKGGEIRWLRNFLNPVWSDDEKSIGYVYGAARDITTERAFTDELRRREAILEAVGFASEHLLRGSDWQEMLPEILKVLGEATHSCRVYLYRVANPENDNIGADLIMEWTAEGSLPLSAFTDLQSLDTATPGLSRWARIMTERGNILGEIDEFPGDERSFLTIRGVRSLVMVPLFVENHWWGFIGFEECHNDRLWSASEIDAIKAAAATISAAIERKLGENRLRELETLYREMVEKVTAVIYKNAPGFNGLSLYTSPQIYSMTGYTSEEWFSDPLFWLSVIHPEDQAQVKATGLYSIETGEPFSSEYRLIRKDGRVIWILDEAILVRKDNGTPWYWQGVMHDITERKKGEALQNALYRISDATATKQDLQSLFKSIHTTIGSLIPAKNLYIAFYDPEKEIISFPYFVDEYDAPPPPRSCGKGLTEYLIRGGQPLLISPEKFREMELSGEVETIHAPSLDWLGIPLKTTDNVTIGALVVQTYDEGIRYTKQDQEILTFVSNQVAMAIERKRAEEALRESNARNSALYEAAVKIGSSLSINDVYQNICEYIVRLLNVSGCAILHWNDNENDVELLIDYHREHPEKIEAAGQTFDLDEFPSRQIALTRLCPCLLDTNSTQSTPQERQWLETHAAISQLLLPLAIHDQVHGLLELYVTDAAFEFNDATIRLAQGLGAHSAIAIENAMLYDSGQKELAERRKAEEELAKRAHEMSVLYEISLEINAQPNMDILLSTIVRRSTQLVGAHSGGLFLVEEDNKYLKLTVAYNQPEKNLGSLLEMGEGVAGNVGLNHKLLVVENYASWDKKARLFEDLGFGRVIGVPLKVGERLIGVITISDTKTGPFSPEEIRLVSLFADQAAIAMENSRLYGEVQHLAITDELTRIYNYRGIAELGDREVARSHRFGRPLSAIFLDIDHFKRINDTYGHAAGNTVLATLVQRLQANLREIDILGRIGGEEFLILLPENDLSNALQVAERLRACIANEPFLIQDQPVLITISLGVAELDKSMTNLNVLIDRVDHIMYEAKSSGRNRVAS